MILSLGTEWFLFLDSLRKTDWKKNITEPRLSLLCRASVSAILVRCKALV